MDATVTAAAVDGAVNPNHGKTIPVCGRQYAVEVKRAPLERVNDGKPVYYLRGARGAVYATMRNEKRPHLMFLVYAERGFGMVRLGSADAVWLTDEGGELREVK